MNSKRKRFATLLGFAVVTAVVLAACSSAGQHDLGGSQTGVVPRVQGETASLLPADFSVVAYQGQEVLGGEEVQFSDLLGQGKPVVLNLWAGLCPPCRLEMPDFEAAHEELGDQVLFLGLDVGPLTNLGTQDDGLALVQELGVTYPVGTTSNADVVKEYQLIGMPTTYFISPKGEIVQQWTGVLTADKLVELVEELIQDSAGS